jgi:hypothetical protein
MVAEIKKALTTIKGNFKSAYEFIKAMYKPIDYVKPSSLDGTYMEPQTVVPQSVMTESEMTDHAAELAKEITKGYQVEIVYADKSKIILRSDLPIAQEIAENVRRFNHHYGTPLEVKTEEIQEIKMPEIDWEHGFSKVGS